MTDTSRREQRAGALERAREHAPFLRSAGEALPDLADCFVAEGSGAALAMSANAGDGDVARRLRLERRALALAVALGDLAGELSLEQVTAALSDFADRAIDLALGAAVEQRVPGACSAGFAVIALGKLGSRELNYSSDVDLILLFDRETIARRERESPEDSALRIARAMVDLLQQRSADGYVARVDLRLRPSPEATPIVLPVEAAISYYESEALPWERAAFIRARAAAGDRTLGERFLAEIQPFIWRRAVDFGAVEEIREISLRIRDHYARGQRLGPGYDLKRGIGGIREVEFYTQVQQLIHGGRDPALRAPAVLDALPVLAAAGRLEAEEAGRLAEAYRRLRTVEHRLQMVADQQTHRLPEDPAELANVAALDGLGGADELLASLEPQVAFVAGRFDSLLPVREGGLSGDPDRLRAQLDDLGFGEPESAARLVATWRSGRLRALRSPAARGAFEAMLPVMLKAIAAGPEPDRALNRFADIVERLSSGINLFRLLEAQPQLAEVTSLILSYAPALGDQLARRPELLDGLIDASSFAAPLDPAGAAKLLARRPDESYDALLDRVRRTIGERRFALGVQLIAGHRDPLELAEGYAALAEGAIVTLAEAATGEFQAVHGRIAGGELLVLALGRLGGMALTHASDLDLIFLYDGPQDAVSDGARPLGPADYFNRLARRVIAALSVATAAGPLYEVDTRLRPEGEKGMLAVHVDAFAAYQRGEAWTWEHMALLRARPVFGSIGGRERLAGLVGELLAMERDGGKVRADAAEMREQLAQHKRACGPLDVKLGPGGLVDLEFAVHTLQLTHRTAFAPRLEDAIAQLAKQGLIDPSADADLRLLSRILVTSRLVAPDRCEPEEQARPLVARVCGAADWPALIAEHDAARQRIGTLWQRVKAG
ncbi:bifunctional [glutamine synthetase] adenylyltransferase/[glutamine synthetase]-adenylyl-L-tyrosine phosphorylase [Sphingomonas mesophila]|uniref:bifunctional [glutamine synthetase] adenylyltransferase/[glutamine synthetase]-adenylyl-L-tyrosine phosphorylase n=1 Tax=Sphingomonas mesophila TaxID=2303576 RepID=UPI000E58A8EA|nr:bifunctional [glutamine synthetase] adenylyltransferase/[glutamine synthetase]-adenylyl-L-tyrosine phosphorylase [Sphingomonas mesophila]